MLHPDCIKKIRQFCSDGRAAEMLDCIISDCEDADLPCGTLVLSFYDKDSGLQPGDWAAEIHLVARKVESIDEA